MTRQNLCPNPACGADTTGWTGGAAPTRVTGLAGFPRTTAARYTSGTFIQTPNSPTVVTPGTTYTLSMYVKNNTGADFNNKTLFLAFKRTAGGDDFSNTTIVNLPNGAVTRVSISAAAVANANAAYLVLDGLNAATGSGFDATAALYEASASLGSYFDGNTAGAVWDGTAENSTSTLNDTVETLTAQAVAMAMRGSPAGLLRGDVLAVASRVLAVRGSPVTLQDQAPPSGGHNAAVRRDIAAAVSTIDGLTGYAQRPNIPAPGDAWPQWRGAERGPGQTWLNSWAVLISLPGDETLADDWADLYGEQLADALQPVLYLDRIDPAVIKLSGNDAYALMVTGRSE